MNISQVTPPATAVSLKSLDSKIPNECAVLILQAPSGNGALITFGNSAIQPFELAAGDPFYDVPAEVPGGRIDTRLMYVKGDASDKLSITWTPYGKES